MKKISVCLNCERELYTNDLDLCKRCHQDVGVKFTAEPEPAEEEEAPSMEDLGIEEGSEVIEAEEAKEEASKE